MLLLKMKRQQNILSFFGTAKKVNIYDDVIK